MKIIQINTINSLKLYCKLFIIDYLIIDYWIIYVYYYQIDRSQSFWLYMNIIILIATINQIK